MLTPREAPLFLDGPQVLRDYGYIPTKAIAILFLALFGLSTILHIGQAARFKTWWLIPTIVLCGIGELIGWGGRLWSSVNHDIHNGFLMQITCTIISPTPLLAASFLVMGRVIPRLGTKYSVLTPRMYTFLFLPCDIIALVVQGLGGGVASSAKPGDLTVANRGSNIMLAGIAFQFAVIIVFSLFTIDFLRRYLWDRPVRNGGSTRGVLTPRLKTIFIALALTSLFLFIRSVYRLIELKDGWLGRVIRTQVYFNVLDGAMVVLAITTWNFLHPGLLLQQSAVERKCGNIELGGVRGSSLHVDNSLETERKADATFN
ncbi:RTA1-domain-containing protein [Roridomyces roridus]|uniref:RTA1-domain-containing protein n=1 Tax=Roridomyces roridus TaxID=1738132 RepID=A0AAD7FFS7_9AGAR|nr:RTA1-domain-containing protein [Roridomyces roridus]